MEITASVEGRPPRRDHRSGGNRFRAEIEMDRGSPSIPRGPGYGFAAAVREPLVRLQRPKFNFERWNWDYFAWPHDRLDANLEMRDSDPMATLEADRKASESFLNRSTLQLERYAMDEVPREQHAAAWPLEQLELDGNDEGMSKQKGGTLEAEQKASESLLSRSTLLLKRREMDQDQHVLEQKRDLESSLLLDGKTEGRERHGVAGYVQKVTGSWIMAEQCRVPGLASARHAPSGIHL